MIKYKDQVTPRVTRLAGGAIPDAMEKGITRTLNVVQQAMQSRLREAHTRTGMMRVAGVKPPWSVRPAWWRGQGPGRIESGALTESIGVQVRRDGRTARRIIGYGGYINPPRHVAVQEPGKGRTPAARALPIGRATYQSRIESEMLLALGEALRG